MNIYQVKTTTTTKHNMYHATPISSIVTTPIAAIIATTTNKQSLPTKLNHFFLCRSVTEARKYLIYWGFGGLGRSLGGLLPL